MAGSCGASRKWRKPAIQVVIIIVSKSVVENGQYLQSGSMCNTSMSEMVNWCFGPRHRHGESRNSEKELGPITPIT